jgi:aldose 1-epimerase
MDAANLNARLKTEFIQRQGRFAFTAGVTPGMGANLVSLSVDGEELIYWDQPGFVAGKTHTGAFNMFPTPCRLANSSYEFEGRKISQTKNGQQVFIHGLVRDESFDFEKKADSITSRIDIQPGHPVFEGFPFRCRFSMTHSLVDGGLQIAFKVENRDTVNIPFGYGVHPFWRIPGTRRDVSVRVPCDHILELKDLVPTGNVGAVAGTPLDLRTLRNIESLFVDNAFWKRNPGATAEVVFRKIAKRMTISASDNFAHMIVYAPQGESFICVENLTTCPNAPNLVSAGKGEVAGMRVVPPGATEEGWIRYTFESLAF